MGKVVHTRPPFVLVFSDVHQLSRDTMAGYVVCVINGKFPCSASFADLSVALKKAV